MRVTYAQYYEHFVKYKSAHPEQRHGQAAFNALYEVAPEVANEIRGSTSCDPFHRDDRMGAFAAYVLVALGSGTDEEAQGS
jgi:hypothetical protein